MTFLLAFVLYAIVLSWMLGRRGIRGTRLGDGVARPGRTGTRPTRVLIVGATGGTGRELVAQALERGHLVTAFVRDPTALQREHPRLRILRGNVLDYASLAPAVRDQDAVLSALGHKQFFRPTRILSKGTQNILAAMDAHGVRRLV
jgi:putative NADH-flavin reductase